MDHQKKIRFLTWHSRLVFVIYLITFFQLIMTSEKVGFNTFETHFCLINPDSLEANVTHIARETFL